MPQSSVTRRAGRPSVAEQRREQIVDAFLALVAARGLEAVTLDDVAAAAGLQRAALRHFVGNRRQLVVTAVEHLTRRYADSVRTAIGETSRVDELLDLLLGDHWVEHLAEEDRAFDALLAEAVRDASTSAAVRGAYDVLIAEIVAAVRRERPLVDPRAAEDFAYAVTCMAEHNVVMQQLGYDRRRVQSLRRQAGILLDGLPGSEGR